MAIKSITKTCPFCGKIYEQRNFNVARRHEITEEDRWVFGTPMKICPGCKKLFIDKDVQELAITEPRRQDKVLITPASCRLALMGLILGLLLYLGGLTGFAIAAAAVGVLCAAVDLALYPTRMQKLKREREASEKRLSDPDYARALKRAGYDIPDRYLKDENK